MTKKPSKNKDLDTPIDNRWKTWYYKVY